MEKNQPTQCQSCGKLLQEDFNICPYCGKPIRITCAKCGQVLEEDFNACPYCGEKVKSKTILLNEKSGSQDFSKMITSILTALRTFFLFLGRAIKIVTLTLFDWVKVISGKALNWLKTLDWEKAGQFLKNIGSTLKQVTRAVLDWLKSLDLGKVGAFLKTLGSTFAVVLKKVFSWVKQMLAKIWFFLKKFFFRLWESLSNILKKKLSPDLAKKAALGIIAVGGLLSLLLVMSLIFGNFSPPEKPDATSFTGVEETESVTILPETQPLVDPSKQKWLVMVYADADDEILEEDMLFDINEMEMTGSSERVQIVTQIDRFNGGYTADGDWTNARRYFITQDPDLTIINSPVVEELGEVNMGDTQTLIDFVMWSVDTYPADRYVLILSDHGGGWTGGWTDPDPSFDYLTLNEMDYAFNQLVPNLPSKIFDIIGFDACLMSQLDVYSAIAPYAHFSIASEEVEPAAGWAYSAFLQRLVDNPAMEARELASIVVDTYLEQDQRFINDEARARLFQGDTTVSIQEVLDLVMPTSTLTAVDLAYIPEINQALNDFAYYITTIDQTSVAAARNYASSFYSVFGKDTPPSFIDLINFTSILEQEAAIDFNAASGIQLRDSLDKAIIKNKAGKDKVGAQGISFYFPNSTMYTNEYGGYQVYTSENNRFMEDSLWDDFLAFHYAGVAFNPDSKIAVLPARSADVAGPGAGEIQVGKIALSSNSVSPDDLLSFNTEITGTNVGNVYMQYGWLAKDVRTMLVVLGMDFIRSDQTRETAGVYYPDWGTSGKIPISYEFEPIPMLAFIADEFEENISFVEVVVSEYGATEDNIIITVPGIFTFDKSGRQLYAEMNFNNTGVMVDIIGYTGQIEVIDLESEFENLFQINYPGEEGAGSPYQITPSVGDTFMPFFTGYVIEDDIYLNVKSDPIAFKKTPLKLVAAPVTEFDIDFPYYIAVVIEDLDGNLTDAVTIDTFTVRR